MRYTRDKNAEKSKIEQVKSTTPKKKQVKKIFGHFFY